MLRAFPHPLRRLMHTRPLSRSPTEAEQKLFSFLLEVNSKFQLHAVLRVAGGWVRDALLGLPSNDIDIAIDGEAPPDSGCPFMTGALFAEYIDRYEKQFGTGKGAVYGVIKANPEQ
eukprot:RCo044071